MDDKQVDIKSLNEKIEKESAFVDLLQIELGKVIVGQHQMLERLLIGLLGQGHILLEGVPGLAKTLAINSLSKAIKASFSRVQFTPDLLPADVIGTMIYNIKENDFSIKKGPVFANFVLADEINRAPAKVQSALLEAMQERQVTIGDESFVDKTLITNGNLSFLHRLKKGRLYFSGCTVDLISKYKIGKYRPFFDTEVVFFNVINHRSDDICREQVGGKLYPTKRSFNRFAQGVNRKGFG